MSEHLSALESKRGDILRQISQVGDLRAGCITATSGRCGKPTCHCAQPKDPGHGPNFRLTRKVRGKTITETFATVAAFHKAKREVAEFHRFQSLSRDLVAVNETICALRPAPEASTSPQEKKRRKPSSRKSHAK